MLQSAPRLDDIAGLRRTLAEHIVCTPTVRCPGIEDRLANGTQVFGKLEFLQRTGTFKARGALATVLGLSPEQRERGVTAVSAGNHAIATAYAANAVGTHARVVMTAAANPARIAACRRFGAEVDFAEDVHAAFAIAERIREEEGRYLVHPFEGKAVATGSGTLGAEICEQVANIDAVVVAIGGGGLIGGIANAIRQLEPGIEVIGVEPAGADSMHRSLAAGEPVRLDKVRTIADSLGAPFALPYSFALCRDYVSRVVLVDDDQLREAMGFLFRNACMAVEPACAAATAAVLGPLRDSLAGKRVVLVFCGSNTDWDSFAREAVL